MRGIATAAVFLIVTLVSPLAIHARGVQNGREYTKRQREIDQQRKQIAVQERHVQDFEKMLVQLDAQQIPEDMEEFTSLLAKVRVTMEHDYRDAVKRTMGSDGDVQEAASSPAPPHEDTNVSPPVERMSAIIREAEGLEHWLLTGDPDVRPRHRHLLGEFAEILRNDVKAQYDEADRAEETLKEGDWE